MELGFTTFPSHSTDKIPSLPKLEATSTKPLSIFVIRLGTAQKFSHPQIARPTPERPKLLPL